MVKLALQLLKANFCFSYAVVLSGSCWLLQPYFLLTSLCLSSIPLQASLCEMQPCSSTSPDSSDADSFSSSSLLFPQTTSPHSSPFPQTPLILSLILSLKLPLNQVFLLSNSSIFSSVSPHNFQMLPLCLSSLAAYQHYQHVKKCAAPTMLLHLCRSTEPTRESMQGRSGWGLELQQERVEWTLLPEVYNYSCSFPKGQNSWMVHQLPIGCEKQTAPCCCTNYPLFPPHSQPKAGGWGIIVASLGWACWMGMWHIPIFPVTMPMLTIINEGRNSQKSQFA